jgi:hypothetical protein
MELGSSIGTMVMIEEAVRRRRKRKLVGRVSLRARAKRKASHDFAVNYRPRRRWATTKKEKKRIKLLPRPHDVDSPRRTRLEDKTQSQNARQKRPASGAGAGANKKQKIIQTRSALDESDSDDLKFRFGRRNKA